MDFEPNPQQVQEQIAFKTFVDKEIMPHADRYDREGKIPAELVAKLAHSGYLGALLPEAYGGRDMDIITYGLLNEEFGRSSSSIRGLVMVQNMIAQTILKWGNQAQKERWLGKIAAGETIAAFALTEPEVGTDVKNIETTATPIDDHYILNGHKQWISFGQLADLFLIFGQVDGKPTAFLLEKDTPGLSIKPTFDMSGLKATMLAELYLEDCRIPKENIVGGVGFGLISVALFALDIGRYSVAWGCVGIGQACLEVSVRHTSVRKQFGVYLKEHQLIRQMISEMVVNVKAARLLCYQAGYLRRAGDPNSIMETFVAKYFASIMATRIVNDAVQIHGAIGCQDSHLVQRHLRDAKIMEIIEGTTQIHQIKIADYGYQMYARS